MPRKNIHSGIVYSTDKEYNFEKESNNLISFEPGQQKLVVKLDKKHRAGKAVTIIEGYQGVDIDAVGKNLKVACGTGGAVKDGIIIIQGDIREKALQWLIKNGFKNVKKV
ncbi:MAG: translation initiation factor [Ferruginibacter sp.]